MRLIKDRKAPVAHLELNAHAGPAVYGNCEWGREPDVYGPPRLRRLNRLTRGGRLPQRRTPVAPRTVGVLALPRVEPKVFVEREVDGMVRTHLS